MFNFKSFVLGCAVLTAAGSAFAQQENQKPAEITTVKLAENFYVFDGSHSYSYVVTGADKALVFDCMIPGIDVMSLVKSVTDLPTELYITHGHMDHTGAVKQWGECWINEKDASSIPEDITKHNIKEGDIVKCGDFEFTVIEIPGHTAGAVAFLDKKKGILISGDTVQPGPIFQLGKDNDMNVYINGVKKLKKVKKYIKSIHPGHHGTSLSPDYIDWCIEDAKALTKGKLTGKKVQMGKREVMQYDGKHASFLRTE